MKIVEQQQRAQSNQDDGANRAFFAPGFQRIGWSGALKFCLGGAQRFKRTVKNKTGQKNAQHGSQTFANVGRERDDNRGEDSDVNQALVVLAVVNCAQPGKESEDEGDGGAVTAWRTLLVWRACRWRIAGCWCRNGGNGRYGNCLDGPRCRRGMPQDRGQAILAVEHVTNRPRAGRAHRFAAVSTISGCVHIRMDGTFHRVVLPSKATRLSLLLRRGSSSASI